MSNKTQFDQLVYDTEPIKKEAEFDYIFFPVQTTMKEYIISSSEVDREDHLLIIALDDITSKEDFFFQAEECI